MTPTALTFPLIHEDSTVIPSKVTAQISLRIVPDQNLDDVVTSLVDFLETTFAGFESPNKLQVRIPSPIKSECPP